MAKGKVNPFARPDIIPKDKVKNYTEDKLDTSSQEIKDATDNTSKETRDLWNEQERIKGTDLYKHQNSNPAKDGGEHGRLNERDYSTTLRLARQADAYNNKPRDHAFVLSRNGPMVDLGTGYERPDITTMETRAMDQSFDLDTNQKKLVQQLQDAIRRKDLDAYIQAMQQLYKVPIDRQQAEIEMRKDIRKQEIQQVMSMSQREFVSLFDRWLSADAATVLYNLATQGNGLLASYIGDILTGGPTPSLPDILVEEYAQARVKDYYAKRNMDWRTANPMQTQALYQAAVNEFTSMIQQADNTFAYTTKKNTGTTWNYLTKRNRDARAVGKDIVDSTAEQRANWLKDF